MEKQGITDGPSPPKPTPRPPTPTPTPPPSADLKAEQVAALHQLTAQYDAAVKGGERLAFKDWLNQETVKFLDEHPKAPPDEKGLKSEGLGPIGWLLFGWEAWAEGLVKATIVKIGEEAATWIIDEGVSVEPGFEPPPSPSPVDGGSPPPLGTDPQADGSGGDDGGDGGVAVAAGDGGGDGGGCFAAGTLVATRDGLRAIEAIAADDVVVSQDEDTEAASLQPVLRTWAHEARPTVLLSLATGEVIQTTAKHRFFVSGQGFVAVSHLAAGDCVKTRANTDVHIAQIEAVADAQTVYNLSVANTQTYFVGEAQAWVHNVKVEGGPDEGGEEAAAAVKRPLPSGVGVSKTTQVPPNPTKPNPTKPSS